MSEFVNVVDGKTSVSAIQLLTNNGLKSLKITPSSDEDNYPAYAANIKGGWDSSLNKFFFTNMNLGSADGIVQNGFRLNYQVQLKEQYRNGKFYPTNGPTYANGRTYEQSLGFAIPSVRSETLSIGVAKIWDGDSSYTDLRKDVTFQLQQKVGNSGSWTDVTGQSITIPFNASGDALNGTFSGLSAVSITQNADGSANYQKVFYHVVEKNRIPGYKAPVVTQDSGVSIDSTNKNVTVTNSLMTTDVDFTKVDEAGKALNGAEFTLYRKVGGNPVEMQRINNPTNGKFHFASLPIGDYVLKETQTPTGFATRDDVAFTVQDSSSGKPTINVTTGSLDDDSSSDGNQIVNHLLPFSLSILKQDTQSKQTIAGVTFSLSEKGTNKEVSTLATDANGMGQFFDSNNNPLKLVTGKTYVIKETKGQDGYVLDNRTIEVTVNANGAITVTRDGQNYSDYSNKDQVIKVTINNQKKGLLPSTGGKGRSIFVIFAFACFVLAIAISGVYFYRNRKGAR
ncbi:LPXTG cell wall anchor domain-containing protein [Listeria monocytogenes]|nr:LPXTG cell wall anchor domain-containing protein [Listeria monocytogenes]